MKTLCSRHYALLLFLLLPVALASCAAQTPVADPDLAVGRALVAYDKSLDLAPEVKESDEAGVFSVSYVSAHGVRVPAVLVLPAQREGKLPCVILIHGLGGSKQSMKPFWTELTAQGYACFAIDVMYHGDRPPSPDGLTFIDHPYAARDALAQTVIDLRRAIDYLETRDDIDSSRIGIAGVSLGAILGTVFAGSDERVKCAALVVGGGDWDVILSKTVLTVTSGGQQKDEAARKGIVRALRPLDPAVWAGAIAPRPVLMVNGRQDVIVPVDANRALQAAVKEPKKIVWYDGGHFPPIDLLRTELTAWFREHLLEAK